jgi:GNAT superfamily N-acetyltransferase
MLLLWDARVHEFLKLVQAFIAETDYPITYSEKDSKEYLWSLINNPDTAVFVHYEQDEMAGMMIVTRANEFHNEYFGYISKMYVLPKFRGTRTGRALLEDACEWFDLMDCALSFGTATAAIGQDQLYINLLGKFGFVLQGTVLIRQRKTHE